MGGQPAASTGYSRSAARTAFRAAPGIDHHEVLGLQIPCIERNAVAAVKASTATRRALRRDGTHYLSLDKAIKTMRDTGRDMKVRYKETARGALAVNVVEC